MADNLNWPLMHDNITRADLDCVMEFLSGETPVLTHSHQVTQFEQEWSQWLGTKHSVFVNSGASANLLTISALRELTGTGEIIVPPLAWISDIASVIQLGFTPVFVDIDPRTLGINNDAILEKITDKTKAVFLTHILGYNALGSKLLDGLRDHNIPLIEDTCESYGATFEDRKLGTFGLASNFSFYYAHHMSTIEGGMVSTNDSQLYEILRMQRSHGLIREATSEKLRQEYINAHTDLTPDFIFAHMGYNMRPTEIAAVIGRSQLKRLDSNNTLRTKNFELFLKSLDPSKYKTDFAVEGSCNYAFTLVLNRADPMLMKSVENALREHGVEFRRGCSGGGNQLRQPYFRRLFPQIRFQDFPQVEHIHFYSAYIGNYPGLPSDKILRLCAMLNDLPQSPREV